MPFEDRTAWTTVLGFIEDYRPDCVIQLGHLVDLPSFRRFSGQATAELRRRELTDTADYVRHNYLSRLRQVHHGPLRIICSAASARLGTALHRKAVPGKAAPTMHVERLVELDVDEAIELSTTYTLAPGWILLYGDTIAVADSAIPGISAWRIIRHLGVSVIVGHTTRLGKGTHTTTGADGVAFRGSVSGSRTAAECPPSDTCAITTGLRTMLKKGSSVITSPLLVTPDPTQLTVSRQGQPMTSLIDGGSVGNTPGSPLSAARVSMRPGHAAQPHRHPDTWILVLLWSAGPLGAITLYGPTLDGRIHQAVGQILAIPPGIPHAAINPNVDDAVVAYEFRSNPSVHNDNVVLAELQPHMDRQRLVLFDLTRHAPRR